MTDVVRCPTVSALCVPAQAQFTSSQAADCKGVHQYPASAPIPSVPSVPPPPPLLPPPAPRVVVADVKSESKSELPPPIRSRRSAFKLSADEKWPWAGVPLSALKARFPDRHTAHAVPVLREERPHRRVLPALCLTDHPIPVL